jgi:ribosomal protein L1
MLINYRPVTGKFFAFDGCHKIYVIENENEIEDAKGCGYDILPIDQIRKAYENSCKLRYINNWSLTKTYAPQFKEAFFSMTEEA